MNLKFFQKAFPTPKFLNIPYVGLAISDDYIRCVKFFRNNGKLSVEFFLEKPVPGGAIDSGVIKNSVEVSNILGEIKKEAKFDFARVSIIEEKAYLFNTKVPKVDSKDIREAIEFKMEENVPVPSSELIFDYEISTPHGHEDHIDVVVSAFPTSIVDSYVETINRAGINVLSLEIESQSVVRSLLPNTPYGAYLVVHLNKQKAGLYVAWAGKVHFTSTIILKGDSVEDLHPLVSEIKRLYIYWHTLRENAEDKNKKINQIILCGDGANEEVVSFLASHTNSSVSMGNVWQNAFDINEKVPPIPYQESLSFVAAIGLALPEEDLI